MGVAVCIIIMKEIKKQHSKRGGLYGYKEGMGVNGRFSGNMVKRGKKSCVCLPPKGCLNLFQRGSKKSRIKWKKVLTYVERRDIIIKLLLIQKSTALKKKWKLKKWKKFLTKCFWSCKIEKHIWRDIEVVITRRSWKPFVRKGAWGRIPLSPLRTSKKAVR